MNISLEKKCTSCKQDKCLKDFGKNKKEKDGHHYYCKECVRNMREANKKMHPEYFKNYREKNRKKLSDYQKDYRNKNSVVKEPNQLKEIDEKKDKKRAKERERRKNPEYVLARRNYFKNKYKTDIQFKLKKQFESKLNRLFTDNDATEKSRALIGCTIPEYKIFLQSMFKQTMTLENYGEIWNLDRVTPFCDFDLTNEEEAKKCFHFSNTEPLFIQTKIIDGVEYIGNMNKNKY